MQELKQKFKCFTCNTLFESEKFGNTCLSCKEKEREDNLSKELIHKLSIIPPKYRNITTDRQNLLNKHYKQSTFITGFVGVGKTLLMANIASKLIHNKHDVKWISYSEFIMELQSAFKKNNESPFDIAKKVAEFGGWLCIDDLGTEKLTDYVRQITYYIINKREQDMLPLIITSNFSLAEINDMIDPRIASRIAGICKMIKMSGKDRRIQ